MQARNVVVVLMDSLNRHLVGAYERAHPLAAGGGKAGGGRKRR